RLHEHVRHRDAAQLGFVGGALRAQLLLVIRSGSDGGTRIEGPLSRRRRARGAHTVTSWAYVWAVSPTEAANTSSRLAPASIICRWCCAPVPSGKHRSSPATAR